MLWHFLHFRLEVVTRRLEHEQAALRRRIHVLEGFDEGLRRARRDHPHHPQVGRQAGRRAEDQQALRPRRRTDRRDPRAEAVPPGAARNPGHPEGAGREAEARAADRRPAQGRGGSLAAGPRRNRGGPEGLRPSADGPAPHAHRGGFRRGRVSSGRLHRRRGHRRHRVARRLGEAAEGSAGPRQHPAARGRLGPGGPARQHAGDRGVLDQLRRGLHVPADRRAGVDRVRRADPAALQVPRRREGGGRLQPRPAGDTGHRAGQRGRTCRRRTRWR